MGRHRTARQRCAPLRRRRADRAAEAGAGRLVLHAPLELLARTALLPLVRPDARDEARDRLVALGAQYAAAGDEVGEPRECAYDDPARAASDLVAAIAAGEHDDADAAAAWLAAHLDAAALRRLSPTTVPRLPRPRTAASSCTSCRASRRAVVRCSHGAARARARIDARARVGSRLASFTARRHERRADDRAHGRLRAGRAPARAAVARRPGQQLHLPDDAPRGELRLARPSCRRADAHARRGHRRPCPRARRRVVDAAGRAGARPYGWSHTLSMPQATLGVARACRDPRDAVAVAATYVLGFRATLGCVRLDPAWTPRATRRAISLAALEGAPEEAVAAATPECAPRIVEALATRAALHHDAHLVSTRSPASTRSVRTPTPGCSTSRRRRTCRRGGAAPTPQAQAQAEAEARAASAPAQHAERLRPRQLVNARTRARGGRSRSAPARPRSGRGRGRGIASTPPGAILPDQAS